MASDARPPRRLGPFSLRQVALVALAAVITAVLVSLANTPLATVGGRQGLANPAATPYLIGDPAEGLRPGELAPELAVTREDGTVFTLTDLEGRAVSLAALRGKAVWIDFWASWCPPCQAETPVIRDAYATYRDRGLEVIAISVQESSADDVRDYARRYDLRHTVAADLDGDVFRRYRVFALPTQFFIDPNGVIRQVVNGPMTPESAAAAIEAVLPAR